MASPYYGRPRPPKMHLRQDKRRRRTVCGRELALVNSVHCADHARLHLVSCRRCADHAPPILPLESRQ